MVRFRGTRMSAGTRRVAGACPLDCPDTCSWIVTVKDGEAVSLRGNLAHSFTQGALCNKVADYLNYTRSRDRVIRVQVSR
jgi:anaerobic selenocysteine-containing dehydrogenase